MLRGVASAVVLLASGAVAQPAPLSSIAPGRVIDLPGTITLIAPTPSGVLVGLQNPTLAFSAAAQRRSYGLAFWDGGALAPSLTAVDDAFALDLFAASN